MHNSEAKFFFWYFGPVTGDVISYCADSYRAEQHGLNGILHAIWVLDFLLLNSPYPCPSEVTK